MSVFGLSGTKDRSFGAGSGHSGSDSTAVVEIEAESRIPGRGPRGVSESMGETLPGERIRRGSMMPRPSLLLGEGELWKEPGWESLGGVLEGRSSRWVEELRRWSGLSGAATKEQHQTRRRPGARRPAEADLTPLVSAIASAIEEEEDKNQYR